MERWPRFFRTAAWWAGVAVMCNACADPPAKPRVAERMTVSAAPLTVAEVLKTAADLRGRAVTVTGRFAGWTGPCTGAPPRTRSDWMLVDASQCIYVSGPVPEGVTAPPDTVSNGQQVTLRVEVQVADDGRPYLLKK